MEGRVKRVKNRTKTGKGEDTGGMINSGGELAIEWVWKLKNMSSKGLEDYR